MSPVVLLGPFVPSPALPLPWVPGHRARGVPVPGR
jgi:hypothetical protein